MQPCCSADGPNRDVDSGPSGPNRGGDSGPSGGSEGICFMPFSEGPRNCVGQSLAKIEVLAVLATMLGSFRVELDPAVRLQDSQWDYRTPQGGGGGAATVLGSFHVALRSLLA